MYRGVVHLEQSWLLSFLMAADEQHLVPPNNSFDLPSESHIWTNMSDMQLEQAATT